MDLLSNPMTWPVIFPLLAGLANLSVPRGSDRLRARLATVFAAVTAVLIAWPLFRSVLALEFGQALVAGSDRLFSLRLDHLSAFVMLAVTVFGFLISLYSMGFMAERPRQREYYTYLLWTIGISCGAVMADNLILLLIFWGILGITLYLMIALGGPDAAGAAKKSFIIIGGSDCLLMFGAILVISMTGTARIGVVKLPLAGSLHYIAYLCFLAAALAKAGAMPLHSWVPDCGERAPIPVTAFLPASLDKLLGIYLLARVALDMFAMNACMNTLLMFLGAGTIICAVMMALVQHDLKRLLSYHAVSQVGYMVLGIGTGTLVGIAGGLFHMLNNAIYKSSLFLSAGAVEQKTGTTDMDKLGGLAKLMPVSFATCVVGALAISGVPPLNGFASKWMIYQGVIESGQGGGRLWIVWLVAAMLGSVLTLASFVKVLHAVFLSKPAPSVPKDEIQEVGASMWAPMATLAFLCLLFGVFAYQIPLRTMIFPLFGGPIAFSGAWYATAATILLLLVVAAGYILYYFTSARKPRECATYCGGEKLEEVYISGEAVGTLRDIEVTGVDFYREFEEMPLLGAMYTAARRKFFDIYDLGRGIIFYFVEALRKAHTGQLPLYLTWMIAGFLVLIWILLSGVPLQ